MLSRLLFLFFLCCYFSGSSAWAETHGRDVFEAMECFKCHDPQYKKMGPTLKLIANTYGKKEKLLSYFNGETESIVEPERAKTMKIRIRKIKKLADPEKDALADYIMSFQGSLK